MLQVIAFLDALLTLEESFVSRVLVLAPVNTLYNWVHEYHRWIPGADYRVGAVASPSLLASHSFTFTAL